MVTRKSFIVLIIVLGYAELHSQDSTIQYIDGCVGFTCVTELMRQSFIDVYGQEKLKWLQYPELKLSPDGQLIAIEVAPEERNSELWLFDLKSHRMRMVMERVPRKKVDIYIRGFKWISNDTVIIFIHRSDKEHALSMIIGDGPPRIENPEDEKYNGDFIVRATIDSSTVERFDESDEDCFIDPYEYSIYNTSPSGKWRFIQAYRSDTTALFDLNNNRVVQYFTKYIGGGFEWTKDEKYVVFIKGEGHGSLTLKASRMKAKLNPFIIAGGSWEMLGFGIPPKGHTIAYLRNNFDKKRGEIVFYDLNKKKIIRIIEIGMFPDHVVLGNHNVLAVTCFSCKSKSETTGEKEQRVPWSIKEIYVYQAVQFLDE